MLFNKELTKEDINSLDKSSKDIVTNIVERFHHFEVIIDKLRTENTKLKSDLYEKEYVAKLKEENERMRKDYYRGFPISEEQSKSINKFISEHSKGKNFGVIGGAFTYKFVPTSIGVIGEVIAPDGDKLTFQDL